MKKIFIFCFSVCLACLLSGCYAFLQADRLVYAGTLAKKPHTIHVEVDTLVTDVLVNPEE